MNSGVQRFTMGLPFLADGIGLISIALGCFGIAEVVKNLDSGSQLTPFNGKIKLMPTWPEFKRIIPSALRGSVIGSFLGILPGGGPTIAQFAAYAIDKRFSKYKDEIGHGAIEGVAGQAAAAEAAARPSFIPTMAIGIPESAAMALMMGAFIIKGIQPGPNMIAGHPELFWGLVASMWVGNCFLVILNVPLVRYWLSVFKITFRVLFPSILFSAASAPTVSTTTSMTSSSPPSSASWVMCSCASSSTLPPSCWVSSWVRCWRRTSAAPCC